jgi:hypothetical protein
MTQQRCHGAVQVLLRSGARCAFAGRQQWPQIMAQRGRHFAERYRGKRVDEHAVGPDLLRFVGAGHDRSATDSRDGRGKIVEQTSLADARLAQEQ